MIHEIDKLKLQLIHKNELILQKDNEIKMLQNLIETLSKK